MPFFFWIEETLRYSIEAEDMDEAEAIFLDCEDKDRLLAEVSGLTIYEDDGKDTIEYGVIEPPDPYDED